MLKATLEKFCKDSFFSFNFSWVCYFLYKSEDNLPDIGWVCFENANVQVNLNAFKS